jgi:hypothetical protein
MYIVYVIVGITSWKSPKKETRSLRKGAAGAPILLQCPALESQLENKEGISTKHIEDGLYVNKQELSFGSSVSLSPQVLCHMLSKRAFNKCSIP